MAEIMKFCRICLRNLKQNEQVFPLDKIDELMLKTKLLDFMSEFDLYLTPEPITCYQCMATIQIIHNFKQLCISTEKTLKEQHEVLTISDHVKEEPVEVMIKEEIVKEENVEINRDIPLCVEESNISNNEPSYDKHSIHYKFSQTHKKRALEDHSSNDLNQTEHEKTFNCNACSFESKDIKLLEEHELRNCFKCDSCNYVSHNQLVTKVHALCHINEFRYKCEECAFGTNHKLQFITHKDTHRFEPVKLIFYGKTYSRKKPFKCKLCNHSCAQKKFLDDHEKQHLDKPTLNCSKCDFKTLSKLGLQHHESVCDKYVDHLNY